MDSGLGLRVAAGGLDDGASACTRLGTSPSGTGFPSPPPLDSGFRRSDELRGRNDQGMPRVTNERLLERAIPDRSPGHALIAILMPAGAGTPRYEKPELWLGTANWHGGFCYAPPRPLRGTSPRATFSHSAIDHRSPIRHVSPVESRYDG